MSTLHPWQFFLITIAGWINRHQQDVIDYLVEENRVLKGQLRGKRLRLTDDERRLRFCQLDKDFGLLLGDLQQSTGGKRWFPLPLLPRSNRG